MIKWILRISLLLWSHKLISQNNIQEAISGEWVQVGSKFDNTLGELKDPVFGAKYFSLVFEKEKVFYSDNPFELYRAMKYKIVGDTLYYGDKLFLVKFQDKDHIKFINPKTGDVTEILRSIPERTQIYKIDHDTIFQSSEHLHPDFKGNFAQYFLNESWLFFPAARNDRKVLVSFTLSKSGQIFDVEIQSDFPKSRNKRFRKSVYKSQSNWVVPLVQGKLLSTRIDLVIVRKGAVIIDNYQKAERNFEIGLKQLKRNPDIALQRFTKAQVLNPSNAKYYFYKGLSHYFLLDETRMCQDFIKANELCPFLPMDIVDNVIGVKVECFKSSQADGK
ncbi:MAG: hypothetical protein HYR67_00720 [Bacteroidetes bacterium]|nr:hypothetical protein [Bacteroidota bacterium]